MIRILIVSQIRFYREGLAEALPRHPGLCVAGTAASHDEARALMASVRPDVVLLEAALPGARTLLDGPARVVVVAVDDGEDEVLGWAEAGVAGYVTREGSLAEVVAAVQGAAAGELHCSPQIAASLLRRLTFLASQVRERVAPAAPVHLTTREREIVELIARGLSNKGIARQLGIEPATAKNHVHNILSKLQVERRLDAAAWLRRNA